MRRLNWFRRGVGGMDAERVGRRKNGEDKQPDLLPRQGRGFEILPGVCGKLPRTDTMAFPAVEIIRSLRPVPRKAVSGFSTNKAEGKNPLSAVPAKNKLAGIPTVCECLHCMATMTKEATVSVRLTAREKSGLDADARMKGIPSGTAAAGYIAEGVRRSRFPAIEFRDGQPGRVAYLVGSRWPVWMIVELERELDGEMAEAVKLIRKPAALVRMALAYADAYPQEIADSAALASRRDYAGMKQEIPELEQL